MRDLETMIRRGRYIKALSRVECSGIPVDADAIDRLNQESHRIKLKFITSADPNRRFFQEAQFRVASFSKYVAEKHPAWPKTGSGKYSHKSKVIKSFCSGDADLLRLAETLEILASLRKNKIPLTLGIDGCSRCMQSPFASKTGRNAPPGSQFIFALPAWMRGIIAPRVGEALIYLDIAAEEIGVAAGLSKDPNAMHDYQDGDFYINSGKRLGIPTHNAAGEPIDEVRQNLKTANLGMLYGIGLRALCAKLGITISMAERFQNRHRKAYKTLHEWLENSLNEAAFFGELSTVYGWPLQFDERFSNGEQSIKGTALNFHIQANAAEILRVATIVLVEAGYDVCATVHDSLLIKAPDMVAENVCQDAMDLIVKATEIVLDGFPLKLGKPLIVRYPYRFYRKGENSTWDKICELIGIDPDKKDWSIEQPTSSR